MLISLKIIGTRRLRRGQQVVCEPEEIGAMFSGGTIFFNAVLRQTIDRSDKYLGSAFTMCSFLIPPSAKRDQGTRGFLGKTAHATQNCQNIPHFSDERICCPALIPGVSHDSEP